MMTFRYRYPSACMFFACLVKFSVPAKGSDIKGVDRSWGFERRVCIAIRYFMLQIKADETDLVNYALSDPHQQHDIRSSSKQVRLCLIFWIDTCTMSDRVAPRIHGHLASEQIVTMRKSVYVMVPCWVNIACYMLDGCEGLAIRGNEGLLDLPIRGLSRHT